MACQRYVSWERLLSDDPREHSYEIHFIDVTLRACFESVDDIVKQLGQSHIIDSIIMIGDSLVDCSNGNEIVVLRLEDEMTDLERVLHYLCTDLKFVKMEPVKAFI